MLSVAFRSRRTLVLGGVVLLVLAQVALPIGVQSALAASDANPASEPRDSRYSAAQFQQQDSPTNNTTVRHRDPDRVSENGDLTQVQSHLARQLQQRLGDSAIQLDQGEYEQARSVLGDEYNQALEQYVDVAGETGNEEAAESIQEATQQQRSFVNETQEYQETLDAYERAKRDGDEDRARQLARELERQSENVTRLGDTTTQSYDRVENTTGADLDETQTTVQNVTQTVDQQQAEIRAAEFLETRLNVSADSRNVSFLDPVTLDGRLETENETPVANRTITLQIGPHRHRVKTNASGQFSLTHRPRTVPATAQSLEVEFVPADTSPYLGSTERVPVEIEQVSAEIRLYRYPETVTYDDRLTVVGAVTATDVPVNEVPIRVTLGDTRLGTVRTGSIGLFRVETRLPAEVPSGEHPLQVQFAQSDRAVTANMTTESVRVEPTATTLSITAESLGSEQVVVMGRLETADGTELENQSVAIGTGGTTRTVVETNATGWYRATVPAGGQPGSTVTVEAEFDRSGTNLEATTARTQLTLPGGPIEVDTLSTRTVGAIALGVLALVGGGWYLWRRRQTVADPESPTERPVSEIQNRSGESSQSGSLLETADATIREDPNAAVRLAYGALRTTIGTDLSIGSDRTHWEFYSACLEAGLDTAGTLRPVIERYEQAAYSQSGVDEEMAEQTVEAVREFIANQ